MTEVRVREVANLNRILVVDDDEAVVNTLKEQLSALGYQVVAFNNPLAALDALTRGGFSVALVDNQMPDMSGLDLLAKVAETHPLTTRILLSSGITLVALIEATRTGQIHRYLTKPWMREDLRLAVTSAVDRYQFASLHSLLASEIETIKQRDAALAEEVKQLEAALAAKPSLPQNVSAHASPIAPVAADASAPITAISGSLPAATASPTGKIGQTDLDLVLGGVNSMLYAYHPNLGNTAQRAVAICQTLGEMLELPQQQRQTLTLAAALHDIGLVSIDRDIVRRWLRDVSKVTEEELALIKKHPQKAEEMLQFHPVFKDAADIIRAHHEHWNGTGYPDALKGETIPWLARLLAVVIFFCNKHSASMQLMAEIETHTETLFDSAAINALAKAVPLTIMPRGEREILMIELKSDMILARDIYNTNGHLLIPKGRPMTDASINKLSSINRVSPLDPLVLVFC